MGQRLVINIIKDNERIANIYYHWSAYTMSALNEAKELLDSEVFDYDSVRELQLNLIRHIESVGGCIEGGGNSAEYQRICDIFPNETFKTDGSRNAGLIAITEDGMNSLESWAEGLLEINLDYNMIYNSVYICEDIEEYNECQEDKVKLEDISERLDIEIDSIKFCDIDDIIEKLNNLSVYEFRHGDDIYELIE